MSELKRHARLHPALLLRLTWRNLWCHPKRTLITLSSIGIGFVLAVFFIGLNDGSHNAMIRNAIKLGEGYITVQPKGYLEAPANDKYLADGAALREQLLALNLPGQVDARISLRVLVSSPYNSVGAGLEGMASSDQRAQMLQPFVIKGEWLQADDERGVVIGEGMARKLKVKVGGKIVLMAGKRGGDSEAQLGRVRAIFDSSMDELDNFLVISNVQLARHFLVAEGADINRQPLTRLAVSLDDPESLADWKRRIDGELPTSSVVVLDWQQMMPQLVQFIVLDSAGAYVFLAVILVLIVFGIVNTVLMSVLERTREFGLLRALGLSRSHLLLMVFLEATLLSVLAVGIGWTLGGLVHLWFSQHGLDLTGVLGDSTAVAGTFMDPVVRTELSQARVLQLTLIVFLTTLTTGIYPAIKAARVTPVAALRT
ncbi:ABC transporter permease [Alcanivorax sediminis]|uniref:FtsX-like permease family protein n=1 Tax=Alcanivorax sediminis TaxID=2663008 RepID=A0A6N7LWH0_9GAMM|nr:FtsX-like permease family protein [Alcanivorax sediminis]MQX53544.1 FtsX-like permease family protein [Alcanivorax sediminis]